MMDRDMRPTRFDLMLEYTREFIVEWFDQNPLGQVGIVGMRGGIGERIGEMSGKSTPSAPLLFQVVTFFRRKPIGRSKIDCGQAQD